VKVSISAVGTARGNSALMPGNRRDGADESTEVVADIAALFQQRSLRSFCPWEGSSGLCSM
jgi:hypothetical protein